MSRTPQSDEVRVLKTRLQIMVVVGALMMLGLVARLFQLQVLESEHFTRRAESLFTDTIDVEAPRGRIFDAKGRPLATNRPSYTLYVTARSRVYVPRPDGEGTVAERVPIGDEEIESLAELLDFADDEDEGKFRQKLLELREDKKDGRYAVALRTNLSWEENARILTREKLRAWVEIRESAKRFYPAREVAAFVTGYMRGINPKRLQTSLHGGYRMGDRVGKTGLERNWENYLRGRLGSRSRVVNNLRRPVKDPPEHAIGALPPDREAIPGQDIYLSVDLDLQEVGYDAFVGELRRQGRNPGLEGARAGGAVAMEIATGRILAMVSLPAIDPNRWEKPISRKEYQAWESDPRKPFVDKTVQENYYPGSTYKVISALAMLEDPGFDPDEIIECDGYLDFGGRRFRDTHRHGPVNLEQAIVQSCNVYFYHLAVEKGLSLARMEAVARKLGLGERTGLGLNAEVPGVVPTEASESRQGTFQRGVLLNSAIGQGNVKATVLQIAVLYAAIANGGYVMTPSLVDRVETSDGRVVLETDPKAKNTEPAIDPLDVKRIHEGLVGVVNAEEGTASSERLDDIVVAGKTGTAQVGLKRRPEDEELIAGWDVTKDHAWFAAYAPAEKPEVVVVALEAHGGVGADAAAPIVMKMIEHYLGDRAQGNKARPRRPGVPPALPGQREDSRRKGGD